MNPAASGFSLQYELSPIVMTGGIAQNMVGGAIPVISLLNPSGFPGGLLGQASVALSSDNAFAIFMPLPGSSLIAQDIGTYPFANQATAANAVITRPLNISFKMYAPARNPGDYGGNNQAMLTAFAATLAQHNLQGGLYTLLTPGFTWTDCVMTGMRDISGQETKQVQYAWQLDFMKPLVTQAQAAAAQNNLLNKISGGANIPGNPANSGPTQSPTSVQAPAVVPAASASAGANVNAGAAIPAVVNDPGIQQP